jgi:hypothetical protein
MMIMLRSTRLCVYSKFLVPFEASLFFCAQTKTSSFFFTCLKFRVSPSKRRLDFFSLGAFSYTLSPPHKTRGKNVTLSLLRARERTTRRRTSTHLISRATFNSRASNTLGACVARSRREIKENNELFLFCVL